MKEVYRHPIKAFSACLFAVAMLSLSHTAPAAEYIIAMTDDWTFDPDYLEIEVNDTVTFVNRDWAYFVHDSVCTGYWNTGYLGVEDRVSLTFKITGTFSYHDSNFYPYGMIGTIVVKPGTPVEPTPVKLNAPVRQQDGTVQLSLGNLVPGDTYIVQVSSNLVTWSNLSTNVAANAVETYLDNAATGLGPRFYRTCHLQ